MPNGIPNIQTGIGAGINIASPVQALWESSVNTRLAEIDQKTRTASENEKFILNAISTKGLDKLSRGVRDRTQKSLDEHRTSVVDIFKSRQGQLTPKDKTDIQDRFLGIQNQINEDVNKIRQFDEARKLLSTKSFRDSVDVKAYTQDLANLQKNLDEGKPTDHPAALIARHMRQVTPLQYIQKNYADFDKNLEQSGVGLEGDKIVTKKTIDTDTLNERVLNLIQNDPNIPGIRNEDGTLNEEAVNNLRSDIEAQYSSTQRSEKFKTGLFTTKKEGETFALESKQQSVGRETIEDFFPISTSSRVIQADAINENTGKAQNISNTAVRVVGVSPEKGKIFLATKGEAPVKKSGETAFIEPKILEATNTQTSRGMENALTASQKESDLKDPKWVEEFVKKRYNGELDAGSDNTTITVQETQVEDGTITVSAELEQKPNRIKKAFGAEPKKDTFTVEFTTLTDPSGEATLSMPLNESNLSLIRKDLKGLTIGGKSAVDVFKQKPKAKIEIEPEVEVKTTETVTINGNTMTFKEAVDLGMKQTGKDRKTVELFVRSKMK